MAEFNMVANPVGRAYEVTRETGTPGNVTNGTMRFGDVSNKEMEDLRPNRFKTGRRGGFTAPKLSRKVKEAYDSRFWKNRESTPYKRSQTPSGTNSITRIRGRGRFGSLLRRTSDGRQISS